MVASDPFPSAGQPLVEFALWYARHGWLIVPTHGIVEWAPDRPCRCWKGAACPTPGKHPKFKGWQSKASTDPDTIRQWWNADPNANVAFATGRVSGVVVVDIDPRNGGDETLRELERDRGPLPETVESLTGGGGWHLLFAAGGHAVKSLSGALGPGVDVKGEGGLAMLPPSKHQEGVPYAWEVEHHPEHVELAELSEWVLDQLARTPIPGDSDSFWAGFDPIQAMAGVPEGQRNDTLFCLAVWLRRQGIDMLTAFGHLARAAANCDPPLSLHEVDSILKSAWKNPTESEPNGGTVSAFHVEAFSTWASEVDAAPDPGWIAEPVWPGDAYGVLAAESKAGKTWAQLDLAVSVATGTDWMNAYPTQQGTVVVFLGEGGERNTVRRVRAILDGRGLTEADLGDRLHLCFRVPHLTDEEHISEMSRVLAGIGDLRLVVLDPLYLAAGGANGASLYDMAVPLEAAQHVTQDAGAALVVVHHFNQTGTGSGARRMSGAGPEEWGHVLATVTVANSTVTDDGRTEGAHLAWKFTGSEIVPTALGVKRTISVGELNDLTSPMTYEIERANAVERHSGTAGAVLEVLTDADDWFTTKAIHDRLSSVVKVSKRTVENALGELLADEKIERQGQPATGYSYRVAASPVTGGAQ